MKVLGEEAEDEGGLLHTLEFDAEFRKPSVHQAQVLSTHAKERVEKAAEDASISALVGHLLRRNHLLSQASSGICCCAEEPDAGLRTASALCCADLS